MGAGGAALLVNMPSPSTVRERPLDNWQRGVQGSAPPHRRTAAMSIKDLAVSCGALIAGVVVAWIAVVTVI